MVVDMLEGTFTMSSSPKKVSNIISRVVEEVAFEVKAGVRISPGPHFDRSPPSLIPEKCDFVLIYAPAKIYQQQTDIPIYDFSIRSASSQVKVKEDVQKMFL